MISNSIKHQCLIEVSDEHFDEALLAVQDNLLVRNFGANPNGDRTFTIVGPYDEVLKFANAHYDEEITEASGLVVPL